MRGTLPTSQASLAVELGDLLVSVDGVNVLRWGSENIGKVCCLLSFSEPRVCHVQCSALCLSFHPMAKAHVHALKGLACRKRVAAASSPARHACGCARPSRARFGHRSSQILSDGSKT